MEATFEGVLKIVKDLGCRETEKLLNKWKLAQTQTSSEENELFDAFSKGLPPTQNWAPSVGEAESVSGFPSLGLPTVEVKPAAEPKEKLPIEIKPVVKEEEAEPKEKPPIEIKPAVKEEEKRVYKFTTPDGLGFDDRDDYKEHYVSLLSAENLKNKLVVRNSPWIDGNPYTLNEISDCKIVLLDHMCQVQIDNCVRTKIYIGPCEDSVFVRNCEDCSIVASCRQLRTRDCKNVTISLFCNTKPVVETSTKVTFAPFAGKYPDWEKHMKASNLSLTENHWREVYDFNSGDHSIPGPHWLIGQADPDWTAPLIAENQIAPLSAEEPTPPSIADEPTPPFTSGDPPPIPIPAPETGDLVKGGTKPAAHFIADEKEKGLTSEGGALEWSPPPMPPAGPVGAKPLRQPLGRLAARGAYRPNMVTKPLVFSEVRDRRIVLTEEDADVRGARLELRTLSNCQVFCLARPSSVTLAGCLNCLLVFGPVMKEVSMDNCHYVELTVACQGIKIAHSHRITLSCFCLSQPEILDSFDIGIGSYSVDYPECGSHLQSLGYDSEEENRVSQPRDSTPDSWFLPSPHLHSIELPKRVLDKPLLPGEISHFEVDPYTGEYNPRMEMIDDVYYVTGPNGPIEDSPSNRKRLQRWQESFNIPFQASHQLAALWPQFAALENRRSSRCGLLMAKDDDPVRFPQKDPAEEDFIADDETAQRDAHKSDEALGLMLRQIQTLMPLCAPIYSARMRTAVEPFESTLWPFIYLPRIAFGSHPAVVAGLLPKYYVVAAGQSVIVNGGCLRKRFGKQKRPQRGDFHVLFVLNDSQSVVSSRRDREEDVVVPHRPMKPYVEIERENPRHIAPGSLDLFVVFPRKDIKTVPLLSAEEYAERMREKSEIRMVLGPYGAVQAQHGRGSAVAQFHPYPMEGEPLRLFGPVPTKRAASLAAVEEGKRAERRGLTALELERADRVLEGKLPWNQGLDPCIVRNGCSQIPLLGRTPLSLFDSIVSSGTISAGAPPRAGGLMFQKKKKMAERSEGLAAVEDG